MYFPYLRGRQFELLAIRELVSKELIKDNVFPIIEPVHLTSTLIKTMEVFASRNHKLGIVLNPQVGSFLRDLENSEDEASRLLVSKFNKVIASNEKVIFSTYLVQEQDFARILSAIDECGQIILMCTNPDMLAFYSQLDKKGKAGISFNLIKDESRFRRATRHFNNVVINDNFNRQNRNADYADCDDESFTDEYNYYKDDGFAGFGDYSIVGEKYNESGFAPYAVAIHIVYPQDDELRIHHFVSDSNDDISDIAGKFGEAVEKLHVWNEKHRLNTAGMLELERLYKQRAFPGLGVIKKLSIMHHLQLMDELSTKGQ